MINKDRIVPATAQDLLGIYFTCMNATRSLTGGQPIAVIAGEDMGAFNGDDFASGGFADEPIKKIIVGEETGFSMFGVLDYDFNAEGFTNAAGTHPAADGCTLYNIILANNALTIRNFLNSETWTGSADAGAGGGGEK